MITENDNSVIMGKFIISSVILGKMQETGMRIIEDALPITIGDIYRAYRTYQGSLMELVEHGLLFGTSPISEGGLCSVDFFKKQKVDSPISPILRGAVHNGAFYKNVYYKIAVFEMTIAQSLFGLFHPLADQDGVLPLTSEQRVLVYDRLRELEEKDFDLDITMRQSTIMTEIPAFDINAQIAFENASYIFRGLDLIPYASANGLMIRGTVSERLQERRRTYLDSMTDPCAIPTPLLFLDSIFFEIYEQPPFPEYKINLADRLRLHDFQLKVAELNKQEHAFD